MSNIGFATLTVIPSARGFQAALRQETSGAGAIGSQAGDEAGRGFSGRFGSALSGLGALAAKAATGIAAGGALAAGFGLKIAASNEQAEISFTTMLGSGEKAQGFLKQLQQFAATTPFEFPELQTAATSLISAGVEADKVIPIMTTLGNVTSGMGTGSEGVKRATVALQQMSAAGRITGEDLNQLRDAGIPVFDLLAGATGKTKEQIAEMAQQGKLGKQELDQLFTSLQSGGKGLERFNGLMEKQSQSLTGMVSTLKDTVGQGLATMMGPAVKGIKDALPQMTAAIDSMIKTAGPAMTGLFSGLIKTVATILPAIAPILGQVSSLFAHAFAIAGPILEQITPVISAVASSLGDALHGLGPLVDAFGELFVAVSPLLPPLADLAGTVLAGLVRAATPIVDAFTDVATSMVGTKDNAGPLVKVVESLSDVINAIPTPALTAMLSAFLAWKTAIGPAVNLTKAVRDLGGVAGFAADKFPKITSGVSKVGPAFKTVGSGAASAVKGLASFVTASGQAVAAGARAAAAFVAQAARSVVAFAVTAAGAVASAAAVAAAWLIAAAPFIAVGIAIAAIALLIIKNWDSIKAGVGAVVEFLVAIPGKIMGVFSAAASWLVDAGKAILGGLLDGIKAYFELVKLFYVELPLKIIGFFVDAATWLIDAGRQVISGLWNGIKEIWAREVAFFTGLGRTIVDLLGAVGSWLLDTGRKIIGGLWDGIKEVWRREVAFFSGIGTAILDAIGDLGSLLLQAGKDLISGLIRGIKSKAGDVAGALSGVLGPLGPLAKKILDSHSPSRVFLDIGRDVTEGFRLGLIDAYPRLKTTAGQVFDLGGVKAVDLTLPSLNAAVLRPTQQRAALVTPSGPDVTYNVEVHNPVPERASESVPRELRRLEFLLAR